MCAQAGLQTATSASTQSSAALGFGVLPGSQAPFPKSGQTIVRLGGGGRHEPGAFHSILLHLMSLIKNIVVLISRIWFIFIIAICHMESTTHYYILATVFYAFFRIDF